MKTKTFHQNKLDVAMGGRDAWSIIVKSVVVKITACVITVRHFDYLFWGIELICVAYTILSLLYVRQQNHSSISHRLVRRHLVAVGYGEYSFYRAGEITLSFSRFSVISPGFAL